MRSTNLRMAACATFKAAPKAILAATTLFLASEALAQQPDNAVLFGARPAVEHASLSPDGKQIAFIAPAKGQGSALYVTGIEESAAAPRRVFEVDGNPQRLARCDWVSNVRLACTVYGVANDGKDIIPFSRKVALNQDGSNPRMISKRESGLRQDGVGGARRAFYGGDIIDWLPESSGEVLMERVHLPNSRAGSLIGSNESGLAAERVNTETLKSVELERPDIKNREFITDGHGNIRIKGTSQRRGDGYDTGITSYFYRPAEGGEWRRLSEHDSVTREGFNPYAIDRDQNAVYGFDLLKGRLALYKIVLDGSLARTPVLSRQDVDVDSIVRLGRQKRPVGASFVTDIRTVHYFDPDIAKLHSSLSKALPGQNLVQIVDATADEKKVLVWAGSDINAGTYYLLDRTAKSMSPILAVRPQLTDRPTARMTSVSYPAADGTMVPAYLTLPPGSDGKNLPAIVMPHGGPSARDEWGFDWLVQYFASQGYAVLQPNYRGSEGYGDDWTSGNGFQSWKIAIGDVQDGGRWLVKQGIADPKQLGIVGWSYGGYAALQSAVTDSSLFKAVVAIAPVTDLDRLREQYRNWSNQTLASNFIGSVATAEEASPARHTGKIKAPVLLFHGGLDRNVHIDHSKMMASRLQSAGVPNRLVTWDNLDHYLEDSDARIVMLRTSDEWLKAAFAGKPAPTP